MSRHVEQVIADWLSEAARFDEAADAVGQSARVLLRRCTREVRAALAQDEAERPQLAQRIRFAFTDGLDGAELNADDRRFVVACMEQALRVVLAERPREGSAPTGEPQP